MSRGAGGLGVHGVWRGYGTARVLQGLELAVAPGEVYGLAGPNGSGKSTALRVVVGLLPPESGRVTLGGEAMSAATRARLGFVPQSAALYPHLTSVETLRFFGRIHGVARRELGSRVEEAVEATGLASYREARIDTLSGGWKQRVSLAAALVHEPRVLVLDEPTTGLDADVRYQVWDLVGSLAARGTSVLLASHGLSEMEAHCHRIGILHQGRVVAEGTPEELRRRVAGAEVAEVDADDGDALRARCRERGWSLRRRGRRWLVHLRSRTTLQALARELSGLSLRSLALRSVTLEDVFLEVAGTEPGRGEATSPPGPSS